MESQKIRINKGLDLPIAGRPDQIISDVKHPSTVALLGDDYIGVKPDFAVSVGDIVKLGQVLFADKKKPDVTFTSPGAGKVIAINRGHRRALISLVIALEGSDEVTFKSYAEHELPGLDRKSVTGLLLQSGLWTSLRARPFGKIADPALTPRSLFITATDSNPLAPSLSNIIEENMSSFANGITVLSSLTEGTVFLCTSPGVPLPEGMPDSLSVVEFSGPHPAGNAGTHIHFLDPVSRNKQVWHINAQDVIAVGSLFTTGTLPVERIVSLAGPSVQKPRLIKTRLGASVEDMTKGELTAGEHRSISGSVLSGITAHGERGYLGRFHQQVSVIPEYKKRDLLGWLRPGLNLYSVKNIVLSRWVENKLFSFNTSTQGERRAIYHTGSYEKVMPLDIMPTFLLKALAVDDIDEAERLGCLELDEEDLALCTFVCPSKIDHGAELRRNLALIEKEG